MNKKIDNGTRTGDNQYEQVIPQIKVIYDTSTPTVINNILWLCLVPTSTTRFASDVGCRMAKI